jgi:DNA-binding phage protein
MTTRVVPAALLLLGALTVGPAIAADPGGVSSEVARTANTSPSEKRAYATASVQEIADADKHISKLLEAAKKDGDAQAQECLLFRQTAVRALRSVAEKAAAAMDEALEAGNSEKANHEFRKIAVAVSKTRMLRAEANKCADEDTVGGDSTIVDWQSFLEDVEDIFDEYDLDDLDIVPPQVSPFE